MATSVGRPLSILLHADTTGFAKGLASAQSNMEKFSAKLDGASRKASVALAGFAAAGFDAVQSASDLNESLSKSSVIFAENAKEVQDWAKTAAKSTGLSNTAALEAASNFALLGKQAGLSGKELNTFSMDFTQLAADLASFNNTSVDEAVIALGAGLRGESEPLRRFGILLNAGMVEAKALEMGLGQVIEVNGKFKNVLSESDKAMARSALIMEQTSLQQGDFARTADGAANKQRILAANIENTKAAIGQGLLPVYSDLLERVLTFTGYAEENSEQVTKWGTVITIAAGAVVALNYAIKAFIVIQKVANVLLAASKILYLTTAAAIGSKTAAQTLAELTYKRSLVALVAYNVAEKTHKALVIASTAAQWAYNVALSANPIGLVVLALAALGAAFTIAYKKIEPFRNLIDSIWDKVKGLAKTLTGGIGKLFGVSGSSSIDTISGARALGGPVRQGSSYLVGERGPEIFTASKSGNIIPNGAGGSVVYNITMNGIVDAESARRSIERVLQESSRRTGAVSVNGAFV